MAESSKGKSRRARKPKKAEPTKQRTLRDMFGGTNGVSQDVCSVEEERSQVVEVSDTEPEPETLPSTPGDTRRKPISGASSLSSMSGDSEIPAVVLQPPKKLFPIFDRSRNANVRRILDDDGNPLEEDKSLREPQVRPSPAEPKEPFRSPSIISIRGPTPEGLTRDVPIVIESTPGPEVKASQTKPVYSIFARQPRTTDRPMQKITEGTPAPYPGRDMQHILDYSTPPLIPPRFPAREKHDVPAALVTAGPSEEGKKVPSEPEHIDDMDFIPKVSVISDIDNATYIDTIPRGYQSCPSVSRVLLAAEESDRDRSSHVPQEQWADRWRPLRADQVIGNEHHALYLRDWLKALRLQDQTMRPTAPTLTKGRTRKRKAGKKKRPDVVRHVKKRRGANSQEFVDDFFAPDDFEEDEQDYTTQSSDWDDFAFCQEQNDWINGTVPSAASSRRSSPPLDVFGEWVTQPYQPPQFGRQISNTILLSGPSGSGKTAAVYACAHELGWEVFEVYPGIGERSGAELNRLIGDVGRNHTVKVRHSPKKSAPRVNFFPEASGDKARPGRRSRRIIDSDDEQMDELDVISLATESSPDFQTLTLPLEPESEPVVNQSVILIEEADILYQTDNNFWPALINIIKDCRRPVVLTCNDPALIPCQDLPLQKTLEFEACIAKLAVPYLQGLSLAEGRPISIDDLDRVYDTFSQDLRKSIQHTQLWNLHDSGATQSGNTTVDTRCGSSPLTPCQTTPSDSPNPDADQKRRILEARVLSRMAARYDAMTLMDCCRPESVLEHYFLDDPTPSPDDELGYRVLHSHLDYDHVPVGPFNRQGSAMFTAAIQHLENFVPHIATLLFSHTLEEAAERYLTRVGPILRSFRTWRVPATDPALHLDYAPWIRCMVSVENRAAEALSQLEGGSQRRRTRNSQRAEAQNWLSLNTTERNALAETSLESD